jgi:hypothetical protein
MRRFDDSRGGTMVIEYRNAIGNGAEFNKEDWIIADVHYPETCKHIADIFADHQYGAVKITVTDREGDRWQYRQVPGPTLELQFRLITQRASPRPGEGPWEIRQACASFSAETLDAIEEVLRDNFGIDHLKIIDAEGDTWEWRLA